MTVVETPRNTKLFSYWTPDPLDGQKYAQRRRLCALTDIDTDFVTERFLALIIV